MIRRTTFLLVALLATLPSLQSCRGRSGSGLSPSELEALQTWRRQREERLAAPDGWLSLIGLHWLTPGIHTFGSARSCEIVLPDPTIPAVAGTLELTSEGGVVLRVSARDAVTVNGLGVTSAGLVDDSRGHPDLVRTGRILFYIIRRGDRIGVRVKDPQSPTRQAFRGLAWYPPDARYRVTARLEPYSAPRTVRVATKIGTPAEFLAPGILRFELDGQRLSLVPLVQEAGNRDLFIIFKDRTNGDETYGAGRFLDTHLEDDGTAILDFNRAVNPPCAYTPYATCPLAPEENDLPVAIRAGERLPPGLHGH